MRPRALWIAIAPVLFVTSALACGQAAIPGVIFDFEQKTLSSEMPKASAVHYTIADHDAKATMAPTGTPIEWIFHGTRQEMVIVNHAISIYTVADKAAVDQLTSQLHGDMVRWQEAMKNMPPAQRAAIEKATAGRRGGAATPAEPLVIHNTGERGTQAGYAAVRWEARRGDKKVREMWVTPWTNVHGAAEAQDAMKAMAGFVKSMMDSLSKNGAPVSRELDSFFFAFGATSGFPVVTREFDDNGRVSTEMTLTGVRQKTIPASEFQPPDGYRQLPLGGGGR